MDQIKWPLHTCCTCLHSICCLVGFIHCVFYRNAKSFPFKKLTCDGYEVIRSPLLATDEYFLK